MIKLYNEDYRKVKLNKKVDFILVDIPYNIGKNAYASNVHWWKDGNYKNGKSSLANTNFLKLMKILI